MLLHDPPENGSWIEGLDILEISVGPARKSREIFEILWNLEKSLKSSKSLKSPEIFTFSTDFKDFTAKNIIETFVINKKSEKSQEIFDVFEIFMNSLKSLKSVWIPWNLLDFIWFLKSLRKSLKSLKSVKSCNCNLIIL